MKICETKVCGFPAMVRGMRNALNSHHLSDSDYVRLESWSGRMQDVYAAPCGNGLHEVLVYKLGPADIKLAQGLVKGGGEHRKALRLVHVSADWYLPLKVWKQVDTYHFMEKLSDSTMHTGMKEPLDVFSFDTDVRPEVLTKLSSEGIKKIQNARLTMDLPGLVEKLNYLRSLWKDEKDPAVKKELFTLWTDMLPDSYIQKRTIDTNYETLLNIYRQRKNHKLWQWQEICRWIETLPYMTYLIEAMERRDKDGH